MGLNGKTIQPRLASELCRVALEPDFVTLPLVYGSLPFSPSDRASPSNRVTITVILSSPPRRLASSINFRHVSEVLFDSLSACRISCGEILFDSPSLHRSK